MKEQKREVVRQRAAQAGIAIDQIPTGGYRIHGRNGFIDFIVNDLADVCLNDLAPQRWK
ncbi:MAG: hypothetical protein JWQ69_5777 [Pseudomonas sp.]|nr:hypothetical protein [Pseudomonas sp.]